MSMNTSYSYCLVLSSAYADKQNSYNNKIILSAKTIEITTFVLFYKTDTHIKI
jgi:hypothetical protein